uniref:C2 domain-containing protein n=2 Tax=Eptatretus burgeri TaxID=7764 RepID=A0A8C4Q5R9_EPTBU
MADDADLDVPVRDVGLARASTPLALEPRDARERQAVSRLSREDLEDRYLRLADDSLQLKQHVSKQEDKIRRMATKLVRLVNDRKKWEAGAQPGGGRNVDMEERVEELQTKVRELERQNEGLRSRLLTTRQQLQTQGRRLTMYPHVAPRVNSGLRRTLASSMSNGRDARVVPSQEASRGRTVKRATQTANGQDDGLLAEAYGEMTRLEEVISKQQEELIKLQREKEEALLRNLRQQSDEHRASMKENLELIRLRREAADKQSAFAEIQTKFSKLHQESVVLRAAHDEVLSRLEEMRNELRNERSRKAELEVQLCTAATTQRSANEMRETMADLHKERDLLKDNYDRLLQSVFDSGREQSWRENERQLKLQLTQLEATMRSDLAEKNRLLDTLHVERESNERSQQELQQLQLKFSQQKQELEELQEKANLFTQTRTENETLIPVADSSRGPNKLTEMEQQAVHAEILQELEKTRSLLFVQHRINKDYQVEVESLSRQIEDVQREHKGQFQEYARLLDGRTLRIRKLEAQIKDVAYGVRPGKTRVSGASTSGLDDDDDDDDDIDPTAYLSRGENLFEIHLERVTLTDEGAHALKLPGSLLFCTYAFYDFELQATTVMPGPNPAFRFTARFSVQPVEAFLDYLQCRAVTLELHTAEGARWHTVAHGTLRFNEAIQHHGRISGVATLAGTDESVPAFATLEYWFGLRFPMEQVLMQFHQQQRALGYLSSPRDETSAATQSELPTDDSSSRNELVITLLRCSDLSPGTAPPRAYAVHRFYDFPDRDTAVSPPGKSPLFNARTTYPICVSPSLDSYLRRHTLDVYIFDDDDDELTERGTGCDAASYLGKAEIPLLPLAHGKDIMGWFELHNSSSRLTGSLEATLCWTEPYRPPIRTRTLTPPLDKAPLAPEPPTPLSRVLSSPKKERLEKISSVPIASPRKSVTFANSPQAPMSPIPSSRPAPRSPSNEPDTTASHLLIIPPSQQFESVLTDQTSQDQDPRKHTSTVYVESEMDLEMEGQLKNTVADTKMKNEGACDEVSLLSSGEALTMETTDELSEVSEELEAESEKGEEKQTDDSESLATDSDEVLTHLTTDVTPPADYIRVEVLSFHLLPEGSAADSSNQQLFVEYSLLGLSTEETETPLSLPKPPPGHSAHFNFSKVIYVDREKHSQQRDMLASVAKGEETFAIVPFTVVSEPLAEQQELDCVDLGTARLDLRDILRSGKDLTEYTLDVITDDGKVIGSLLVTIEALAALKDTQQDRRNS